MICSMSAGKSGPSWLDRLRTAKGIIDDGPTDLENFLKNPNPPNPKSVDPNPNPLANRCPNQNEGKQLINIMSNVLNELFNFGDNCGKIANFKKSARKQRNPRICAFSSNASRESENGDSEKATMLRRCNGERLKECEKEVRDVSLVGFSRTEVTVIDTSFESWKLEKFLYRKRNVWKVRDKKVRSESVGGKKRRKASEEDRHGGKKSKVDRKGGSGEGCVLKLNEINTSEAHKKNPNKVGGPLKKKQSDAEMQNGTSSVILIKSIHTGKKTGTSISKSCLKPKQKKT